MTMTFDEREAADHVARQKNIAKFHDDLRAIAVQSGSADHGGDFAGAVQSYIEKCHPADSDFYFEMWPGISSVVACVALGEVGLEVHDYSNLSEMSKGITDAIYMKAMHDCAKVFGVSADSFDRVISDSLDCSETLACPELLAAISKFDAE